MPSGGELTIKSYQEAAITSFTIHDTGNGIPDKVKPELSIRSSLLNRKVKA